jgi:hypothetical protein
MERLAAISQCEREIAAAVQLQKPGDWSSLLWEMDQRRELHRLLFEGGDDGATNEVS